MKKVFLGLSLVLIILYWFSITTYAHLKSDIYSQGIYKIKDSGEYLVSVKLFSTNNHVTILVTDTENHIKLYKDFYKETHIDTFSIGYLEKWEQLIILGDGQLSVKYHTNKD